MQKKLQDRSIRVQEKGLVDKGGLGGGVILKYSLLQNGKVYFGKTTPSINIIYRVSKSSVGDDFCLHLGSKYADFQEKIFAEISGKKFQTLCIT